MHEVAVEGTYARRKTVLAALFPDRPFPLLEKRVSVTNEPSFESCEAAKEVRKAKTMAARNCPMSTERKFACSFVQNTLETTTGSTPLPSNTSTAVVNVLAHRSSGTIIARVAIRDCEDAVHDRTGGLVTNPATTLTDSSTRVGAQNESNLREDDMVQYTQFLGPQMRKRGGMRYHCSARFTVATKPGPVRFNCHVATSLRADFRLQ